MTIVDLEMIYSWHCYKGKYIVQNVICILFQNKHSCKVRHTPHIKSIVFFCAAENMQLLVTEETTVFFHILCCLDLYFSVNFNKCIKFLISKKTKKKTNMVPVFMCIWHTYTYCVHTHAVWFPAPSLFFVFWNKS